MHDIKSYADIFQIILADSYGSPFPPLNKKLNKRLLRLFLSQYKLTILTFLLRIAS